MPKQLGNVLRAVLFTDVVGSTELARELGDVRWSRLLAEERRLLRAALKSTHGHEVDTAGDGLFAVFDSPADAVRCAFAAARSVQDIGLDIRAGVHFGEIEMSGGEAHGIVVHTGARVTALAGPAELLITQTVKDLVAGSRFQVNERGTHELKGVPGTWAVYEITSIDDQLRPHPIEGATVATERRERASAGTARRPARWVIPLAIGLAVVTAAGVFAIARPKPTYVPSAGTVVRINGHGRFERPIEAASFPTDLASGLGFVWIVDRNGQIFWVDTKKLGVQSRGTAGTPTGAAVGGGAVWITNGFGTTQGATGSVGRLDPSSHQIVPTFDTPIGSQAITWGADAVWVANRDTGSVTRFEPAQLLTSTFPLPASGSETPEPDAIAFGTLGGAALWIGDSSSGRIFRLDASDPTSVKTSSIGGPASAIAVGSKEIFVASESTDTVYIVDPSTLGVRNSIDVGTKGCNAPNAITVAGDSVWVACSLSQKVIRIDPATAIVNLSLAVNGAPDALVTDGNGLVWVAVRPR